MELAQWEYRRLPHHNVDDEPSISLGTEWHDGA